MTEQADKTSSAETSSAGGTGQTVEAPRQLSPAARRALQEAEERRRDAGTASGGSRPAEIGGREGPDPVRYGDWEKGGIASDF